ncbi:MAG: hypothetical protein LBH91_09125 [Prevotellaceae bacterium]|nr:hypothetical protein [Prevotellaceae bacterium]
MAITGPNGTKTKLLHTIGDRRRIIERTAANALNLLRLELEP